MSDAPAPAQTRRRRRRRSRGSKPANGQRPAGLPIDDGDQEGPETDNPTTATEAGTPSATPLVEGILYARNEKQDAHLRHPERLLQQTVPAVVVPRPVINELGLRHGLKLGVNPNAKGAKKIRTVEGGPLEAYRELVPIYDATALDPEPMIRLEHDPREFTTRIIDLLCPIGFGQRGLIVAPPRVGKTILLQNIAKAIGKNYPNVDLNLLLIDERPEEVTDMRRNVPGQVWASSNDNDVDKHLDLAQIVIERCKRLVEYGKDVVVLMDSLTRVGRAFNHGQKGSGKTLTGGLDSRALEIPKRLFGSARKVEGGGSLTIIATALVDTNSAMDEVIFEEFKGTGNMELVLDRKLANERVFPAINIGGSGTRKEEKLQSERELAAQRKIRRHLLNMQPSAAMQTLMELLNKYPTNADFIETVKT